MKTFLRVTVILLCMFSAVVTLIYMGSDKNEVPAPLPEDSPSLDDLYSVDIAQAITFPQSVMRMARNEEYTLTPDIQPTGCIEQISWSSSDESVVRIDGGGKVTAQSSGRATVTASCSLCSASVEIVVGGDAREDTLAVIEALAADSGSYLDAQQLYEQLGSDRRSENLRELLGAVLAYAAGSGNSEALRSAIDSCGFPEEKCLTAAAVCYAKWEELHSEAVISFAGDVTLARYNEVGSDKRFPAVYAASGSYTYPFDRVKGIFSSDSLTVVNFEGTLTGSREHRDKTFYFRGDPLYAGILPASDIEAAGLANNHSGDYFNRGFNDTVKYLGEEGVSTFYEGKVLDCHINGSSGGIPVVLMGLCSTGPTIPEDELESFLADIRSRKSSDNVVIAVLHWGIEGDNAPDYEQRQAAFDIIDAGADLIVGHHPHVLQGIEKYRGKYIAYSLGNFAFGGHGAANHPQTMILRARIGRESGGLTVTGISAVPCLTTSTGSKINNYQPCLRFGEDGRYIIGQVLKYSRSLEYGITELEWSGI